MAEANLKETFYRQFNQDVASLQSRISALPDTPPASRERNEAIDECLAGIDRLSHDVKDASSYLPAYDQRTYSEAIKALSEKLQNVKNTFDPPKKFSFRNKKKTVQAPAAPVPTSQAPAPPPASSTTPTTTIDKPDTTSPNGPLSHKNATHITLPPTPYTTSSSPTLSHLTRCVVDLSPSTSTSTGTPFAALYLRNIKDSMIICGQVAGAIHVTDMTNSVVVVACRQFRMHASKRVDVYVHSTSRPIFEDCEGLRFAPLPEIYMTPEMSQSPNQWNQIDDFKWLKAEPSPHFTILPENERIPENVWRDVVPEVSNTSLDDTLEALHVQ